MWCVSISRDEERTAATATKVWGEWGAEGGNRIKRKGDRVGRVGVGVNRTQRGGGRRRGVEGGRGKKTKEKKKRGKKKK